MIIIVLRVRPTLDKTTSDDITTLAKSYAFDRVFGSNSTQDQLFRGVASNLVDKLIQGELFGANHMQAGMSCVHRLLIMLHIFARMSVYNNRSQCNAVGLCKLRHTRTISDGYILLRRVVTQGHPLSGKTYTLGSGVMEEQGGNANPESEGT